MFITNEQRILKLGPVGVHLTGVKKIKSGHVGYKKKKNERKFVIDAKPDLVVCVRYPTIWRAETFHGRHFDGSCKHT